MIAGGGGRRRPVFAVRADNRQGSRLTGADARSRAVYSGRWNGCPGGEPVAQLRRKLVCTTEEAVGRVDFSSGPLNLPIALAGTVAPAIPDQ